MVPLWIVGDGCIYPYSNLFEPALNPQQWLFVPSTAARLCPVFLITLQTLGPNLLVGNHDLFPMHMGVSGAIQRASRGWTQRRTASSFHSHQMTPCNSAIQAASSGDCLGPCLKWDFLDFLDFLKTHFVVEIGARTLTGAHLCGSRQR